MTVNDLIDALRAVPGDHSIRTVDVAISKDGQTSVGISDVSWDGRQGKVLIVPIGKLFG